MLCPACHVPNADDHRFCENCGTGLPRLCLGCGHECGPLAKFCGNCGTGLGSKPAPVAVPQTSGWAELKSATILFADIVSSTEQIDGLDPEQTMGRLRPAIAQMCRTIESFGGTVVRTLGDGIMAIFGAPRALEGHARLSCQAALALQGVFQRESESQGFSIRVGLHSGQVAADPLIADGVIGPDVYGHAIHLASRVVGLADPGGVCITSATLALIRQECEVRGMGFHRLKGIAEPVEIHAVLRIRNELESLQFHQPALSAFRGREQEFAVLQAGLQRATGGQGAVIGVCGVPGSGKSRLCNELAHWCREQQMTVYKVRTEPYGHAAPLQSVLALMRTCFFQISGADDAAATRIRIAERLAALGPLIGEDQALLNEFFSVAEVGGTPCTLNPKARRTRLLELVRTLAQHVGEQVSVIVFEDLHWLDEASAEFLAALVDATAGTHLLLLLNYRPGYRAPWLGLGHFQQLDLTELHEKHVAQLVADVLAHRSDLQDAVPLIVERAAGNPFFAEELAHSLADSAPTLPPDGSPERLAAIAQALPPTVQAVIGERIDRLVASQKAVLHICAVIGKEVPQALLQQVAVSLASQLERELDGLCEAELLLLLREIASGRRFAFRHPLIQEVAYNAQLKIRRAELHAAVAVAMELHYHAKPDEYAALIAFHFEAAGQRVSAAKYTGKAAQWVGSTDSAQAIKRWHKVRALLHGQPRDEESDRLRAMACSQIALLGWREGLSLDEVQPFIDEAMDLASKVDSRLSQLLLMIEGRMLQASGGSSDGYVERVHKALSLVPEGGDPGRVATLNASLSQAYGWAGLLEHGLTANDIALSGIESIDRFDREFLGFSIEQWLLGLRGRLLTRMGRFDEAESCFEQLVVAGESTGDPTVLLIAHHGYVDLAGARNDIALAQKHAERLISLNQRGAMPYFHAFAMGSQGVAAMLLNDCSGALSFFTKALLLIRTTNASREYETEVIASIAECHRRVGNYDRSLAFAAEAIEMSQQRSARISECRALITYGTTLIDAHGASGVRDAEAKFDDVEKLVQITGAYIFEAPLQLMRERLRDFRRE